METDIYPIVNQIYEVSSFAIVGGYVWFLMALSLVLFFCSLKKNKFPLLSRLLISLSGLFGLWISINLGSQFVVDVLVNQNPVSDSIQQFGRLSAYTSVGTAIMLSISNVLWGAND